jgi:hypothetical protein
MSCIRFTVPVKAPSLTNQREHFRVRHARTDAQRGATRRQWPGWDAGPLLVVRLTRVAPRRLDDDNVRGALKSVRDEVAALLRVDDASPLVRWEYGAESGPESVRVEVAWGTAPAALMGQVLHQLAQQADAIVHATGDSALPAPGPTWQPVPEAPGAVQDASGLPVPGPAPSEAMATPPRPPRAKSGGAARPSKSKKDWKGLAPASYPAKEEP